MTLSLKIVTALILVLLASPVILLNGCGNTETAPFGSTITIDPPEFTLTDGMPTAELHDKPFTVTVKDPLGQPMNKTKITVSFIWAVPDIYAIVQLLDSSGNFVNSPFDAVTDESGTYTFTLRFNSGGGLSYLGNIEVRSGTAFGSASFEIKAS